MAIISCSVNQVHRLCARRLKLNSEHNGQYNYLFVASATLSCLVSVIRDPRHRLNESRGKTKTKFSIVK